MNCKILKPWNRSSVSYEYGIYDITNKLVVMIYRININCWKVMPLYYPTDILKHSFSYSTPEEAADFCNTYLIRDGYTLLSYEQMNKIEILL